VFRFPEVQGGRGGDGRLSPGRGGSYRLRRLGDILRRQPEVRG